MKLEVTGPGRVALQARFGERVRVTAVYVRCGTRTVRGRSHATVLLRDVRDAETGALLADHLWFNRGKLWRRAALAPGDVVTFCARPIEYRTGYWGPNKVLQIEHPPRRDYRLTPPEGLQVYARVRANRGAAA